MASVHKFWYFFTLFFNFWTKLYKQDFQKSLVFALLSKSLTTRLQLLNMVPDSLTLKWTLSNYLHFQIAKTGFFQSSLCNRASPSKLYPLYKSLAYTKGQLVSDWLILKCPFGDTFSTRIATKLLSGFLPYYISLYNI